jgi:RNA polymerase sigma factor (sigma-70 family)
VLNELCKKDTDWRDIAYKICKDKFQADDLVNDMYLKLHETGKRYDEINEWYIWVTIANLHRNILKKTRPFIELSQDLTEYIDSSINRDKNYLGLIVKRYEQIDAENQSVLEQRMKVSKALDKMDLWDREILYHTSEKSLRDLERLTGISVNTLFREKHKALEKLKAIL